MLIPFFLGWAIILVFFILVYHVIFVFVNKDSTNMVPVWKTILRFYKKHVFIAFFISLLISYFLLDNFPHIEVIKKTNDTERPFNHAAYFGFGTIDFNSISVTPSFGKTIIVNETDNKFLLRRVVYSNQSSMRADDVKDTIFAKSVYESSHDIDIWFSVPYSMSSRKSVEVKWAIVPEETTEENNEYLF